MTLIGIAISCRKVGDVAKKLFQNVALPFVAEEQVRKPSSVVPVGEICGASLIGLPKQGSRGKYLDLALDAAIVDRDRNSVLHWDMPDDRRPRRCLCDKAGSRSPRDGLETERCL